MEKKRHFSVEFNLPENTNKAQPQKATLKHVLEYKSSIIVFLMNLVPIYGVLFLNWSFGMILFLYWVETVIIGILNVFKMLLNQHADVKNSGIDVNGKPFTGDIKKLKWTLIPFFIFHYGLFNVIHLIFLVFIVLYFLKEQSTASVETLLLGIVSLLISHVFSFFYNYINREERKTTSLGYLFIAPYPRIVVMHLVLLFGIFATVLFGISHAFLFIFIGLKTLMDVISHVKERDKSITQTPSTAQTQ